MKIVLITLLCLFFAFSAFAQPGKDGKIAELPTVGVEDVYLAKDNGEGAAGEATEYFLTTDIPIYCVVQLDSLKPAAVRMNLVAVSVQGVKAESRVFSVTYKTDGKQNIVNFTGKPAGAWTAGNYRIDIFIDDKLAIGKSFEIKKTPSEIQVKPVAENFVPPRSKPRVRAVKQTRKN